MRQHVNPLSRFFQLPLQLPSPDQLFERPEQPIHLDIGCARGRCLLGLAEQQPSWNHLGVEIRRPLVQSADRDAQASEHGNVRVLFCNANISLEGWMGAAALEPGRELFLQSDVREVIEPMVALTELSGCFERPSDDARPWRLDNPLPVPTERERYVLEQGLPVYRVLYRRNHQALPERTDLENRWQEIDNPADGLPSDS